MVVSIFVNPKQFGPAEDFSKYPRRSKQDRAALWKIWAWIISSRHRRRKCIPLGFRTSVVVEGLSDRLEGRSRPGHFRGVTTVVLKLFEIVQPRFAYFGRKDAQQARIIRQMSADLNLDTGSSRLPDRARKQMAWRFLRATCICKAEDRRAATALSRSLAAVRDEIAKGERDAARLLAALRRVLRCEPRVALDYAEIVDS